MIKKISVACIQAIVFLTPVVFYTGAKDNFLIKETVFGIFGLAVSLLLLLEIFTHGRRVRFGWLGVPLILYLAVIALSSVNAVYPQLVFEYIFFWTMLVFIYFTVKGFSEDDSAKILNTVFVAAFIAAFYGIVQYLGGDPVKWLYSFGGRPSSTFGNPNFFSGYLLLVFPLVFAKMISTRKPAEHIFWMIFCFIIVLNIGVAQTRGAWIAFFAEMICIIVWQMIYTGARFITKKRTFRGTFWFFLLFSALAIISVDRFATLKSFFNEKNPSVNERIFKWKTGWQMIKGHPFFGVGAGNLKVNFANYQSKVKRDFVLKSTSESNLHNEFLQRFAETGIIGLSVFLSVFFVFFFRCAKLLLHEIGTEETRFNLIAGIFTGVFSVFIYGLTNFPFSIIPISATMFVFFGISESFVKEKYLQQFSQKYVRLPAFLITGFILILLIYKIVIPRLSGDIARHRGDIYFAEGKIQPAILEYEKAVRSDYYNCERSAFNLGEAYRKLNQIDKAVDAYKISAALRNYGEVYNNIGNCYYLKKDFNNALFYWKKAVEIGLPDDNVQNQVIKTIDILSATGGSAFGGKNKK